MEVITIVAVANSVQYLYKFAKIVVDTSTVYYSSTEILHKITMKSAYKHMDNANNIYEMSTYLLATNQPASKAHRIKAAEIKARETSEAQKTINNKKYIKNPPEHIPMSKRMYKFVSSALYQYHIRRLERTESRAERDADTLYRERLKRDVIKDKIMEEELFEVGFMRDESSRHFISPSDLLQDIATAVLKNMTDPKWSVDDKTKLKALIVGGVSESNSHEFERFTDLFYYVDLCDRITKRPFVCSMLGDELPYSIKTILLLQKLRNRMPEREVIEIERLHKCAV